MANPSELQILDSTEEKEKSQSYKEKYEQNNMKPDPKQCGKRCLSKLKIIWSFISFLISVADVTVIIYLSYLHFSHSQDMLAWLMLLPILLNFIGIFTFLSTESERKEMESLGCQKTKHLMFFPVVGPAFSALRLFSYAFEEENVEKYERLESLLTKMKQYESFFRASPEAFVQITFRIVSWSNSGDWHDEDYWTSVCIALCMFSLAESNIYASVLPAYYRLFNHTSDEGAWRTDMVGVPWRIGLFFFNYFSIASRLFVDAIFRATACFYFTNLAFGEVIIMTFIFQFFLRALVRAMYQNTLMDYTFKLRSHSSEMETKRYRPVQEDLTGVYGAFTYGAEKGQEGPVFGTTDQWNGLGVFFDSFDNDNKHNNPYIMAITNDGSKHNNLLAVYVIFETNHFQSVQKFNISTIF